MSEQEKRARLNLVRYGMFLVVVLALTITPIALFLAEARVGGGIGDVLMPTLIATVLAALVAAGVYVAYSSYLNRA